MSSYVHELIKKPTFFEPYNTSSGENLYLFALKTTVCY